LPVDVHLDISVHLAGGGSAGVISGCREFERLPRVGERVEFWLEGELSRWFSGSLLVEHVLPSSFNGNETYLVMLETVVAPSWQQAFAIAEWFEKHEALLFDSHHAGDLVTGGEHV
jgi:hypothetical protein